MGGGVGERAGAVSVSVQPKQIIDPPSASAATLPAIVGLVLLADGIFGKRRGRGESLIGRGRRLEAYVRAGLRRAVHRRGRGQIGREHVWTPVTNAHLVCRLLLEIKKTTLLHSNDTNAN